MCVRLLARSVACSPLEDLEICLEFLRCRRQPQPAGGLLLTPESSWNLIPDEFESSRAHDWLPPT